MRSPFSKNMGTRLGCIKYWYSNVGANYARGVLVLRVRSYIGYQIFSQGINKVGKMQFLVLRVRQDAISALSRVRLRNEGSFPEQRLVIQPTHTPNQRFME